MAGKGTTRKTVSSHESAARPATRRPALRRRPKFAGWLMLAIAGLAVFLSGPAQTYGVSTFVDPMLADRGWSRSLFSTAYSAATLVGAGVLLVIGREIDHWGSRLVLTLAAVLFGASLLVMSVVGHPLTLLLGFALLRAFGSSVLTLAARTLIPHWFVRRRGRAFSLLGLGAMLSLAVIPPTHELLIDRVGWRGAWRVDALIIWFVLLPVVALLVRDRPEAIGQLPDGERPLPNNGDRPAPAPPEVGLSLREAMRTRAFWGLLGASVVPSLVVTGLAFNQVSILTDRGLPGTLAATSFTIESAVAFPATLLAGWLLDRYPARYALAAGQALLAIAMVWLLLAGSPLMALVYAAWRGASGGFWMVAADVAWPGYFGRRHLGSIRSFGFAAGVAGAAIGPIPFGLAFDAFGSYRAAIAGLLVLPVVAMVAVLWATPPAPPAPASARRAGSLAADDRGIATVGGQIPRRRRDRVSLRRRLGVLANRDQGGSLIVRTRGGAGVPGESGALGRRQTAGSPGRPAGSR